jgi:hypothetical protein
MNTLNPQLRGAHACSVLVVAFRDDELPRVNSEAALKSSFRQNAETSPPQAGAPQTMIPHHNP